MLISWAREHGGSLKLAEFRAANQDKVAGIAQSFYSTTMYSKMSKLVEAGTFMKVGPGLYRLTGKAG